MGEAEIKVDNTVPMLRWEEESGSPTLWEGCVGREWLDLNGN